jgi:hypothetical protein
MCSSISRNFYICNRALRIDHFSNLAKPSGHPVILQVLSASSEAAYASQFFIAGGLCRQGYFAVVTLGNTPNTDVSGE